MEDALRCKHDEEMKSAAKNWLQKQQLRFTKLHYMPSFESGSQLWNAMVTKRLRPPTM